MFKNKKIFGRTNKGYEEVIYTCDVVNLNEKKSSESFERKDNADVIFNRICEQLGLREKYYFGLRQLAPDKQRLWLDLDRNLYKQLKISGAEKIVCFRVQYYPCDISKITDENTRYLIFLQVKRDLKHGRLICNQSDSYQLASYIVQSEVGDYEADDPAFADSSYISPFKVLPKQTPKHEEKIMELHKTLTGLTPADAELKFLEKAFTLDTYGIDPHPVRDQKGNQLYLGINHHGIVTFQGTKRTHIFKWEQINKMAFEGKMFIVHITITEKKHACGFKCPTFTACKHLWKCAIQQQYFFTLGHATDAPKVTSGGGLFTRGSKFRYSGRVQREVFIESALLKSQEPPPFKRSISNPQFVRQINKDKSMSLNFRNMSYNERSVDRKHMSVSDLKAENESLHLDDTIPAECRVTSSDSFSSPYDPVQTPMSNEKQIVAIIDSKNQEVPDSVMHDTEIENKIKAQEAELQETEKRIAHLNDKERRLSDTIDSEPNDVNHANNSMAPPSIESLTPPAVTPKPPAKKRSWGGLCVSVLLGVLVCLLVLFVLVFETKLQLPVISQLRSIPQVDAFGKLHYEPFKTQIGSYLNNIRAQVQGN